VPEPGIPQREESVHFTDCLRVFVAVWRGRRIAQSFPSVESELRSWAVSCIDGHIGGITVLWFCRLSARFFGKRGANHAPDRLLPTWPFSEFKVKIRISGFHLGGHDFYNQSAPTTPETVIFQRTKSQIAVCPNGHFAFYDGTSLRYCCSEAPLSMTGLMRRIPDSRRNHR